MLCDPVIPTEVRFKPDWYRTDLRIVAEKSSKGKRDKEKHEEGKEPLRERWPVISEKGLQGGPWQITLENNEEEMEC